ncbi:MAG: LL-diaminopimelate aminotransferase [Clostridia bacterium]|nr:LL-diaminopimelate aminotransferase [Clostridia bacterium]
MKINAAYGQLAPAFFFTEIGERVAAYQAAHPDQQLLRLGVGDVTGPLVPEVMEALRRAVGEQGRLETFHGYLPETGTDFMKAAVSSYYGRRGVELSPEEIFISSGAADDLGAIGNLFSADARVLVAEPAYPAYVDTSRMAGRRITHLMGNRENGFLPLPGADTEADLVYLCSPNNPTGTAYTREQLQQWVDWANDRQAVIVFDAAYEAYIQDEDVPHSIYELPGAGECAVEICSLSKTAGFTGMRLGYTVVRAALVREGFSLRDMWTQDRTTRTNGVSYVLQRAGEAALSPAGLQQNRAAIAVYQENGRILSEALRAAGVYFTGGRNAPYLWLPCPQGMTGWAFFDHLLREAQIVVTPGEGFGAGGAGHVRLSCFGSREDTKEAAHRLLTILKKGI